MMAHSIFYYPYASFFGDDSKAFLRTVALYFDTVYMLDPEGCQNSDCRCLRARPLNWAVIQSWTDNYGEFMAFWRRKGNGPQELLPDAWRVLGLPYPTASLRHPEFRNWTRLLSIPRLLEDDEVLLEVGIAGDVLGAALVGPRSPHIEGMYALTNYRALYALEPDVTLSARGWCSAPTSGV